MSTALRAIDEPLPDMNDTPAVRRLRLKVLLVAIVVTEVVSFSLALTSHLKPIGSNETVSFDDVTGVRSYAWAFFLVAGVNVVLAVAAVALAILVLAPRRGSRWALTGAVMMWLGSAVYGAGVAGWGLLYWFAGNAEVLGSSAGHRLFTAINADQVHFFAVPLGGTLLVAIGGFVATVGVWRAGTAPRWLLLASVASTLGTFAAPPDTWAGTLAEAVSSATTIGIGWCAWRLVRNAAH
jgi:hypothetical protein